MSELLSMIVIGFFLFTGLNAASIADGFKKEGYTNIELRLIEGKVCGLVPDQSLYVCSSIFTIGLK